MPRQQKLVLIVTKESFPFSCKSWLNKQIQPLALIYMPSALLSIVVCLAVSNSIDSTCSPEGLCLSVTSKLTKILHLPSLLAHCQVFHPPLTAPKSSNQSQIKVCSLKSFMSFFLSEPPSESERGMKRTGKPAVRALMRMPDMVEWR